MNRTEILHVAVVGGGIAGLALAIALGRMDNDKRIEVDIYEAATELSQVGAGILIWPRTWEVLTNLGLAEELAKYLPCYPNKEPRLAFQYRKSDQKTGITMNDLFTQGGANSFHRAELQSALLKKASQKYRYHLSHRLISYKETASEVILTFQNGSKARCDLLVGADGIKSVVRRGFIIDKCPDEKLSIDPSWSGSVIYRGLCDSRNVAKRLPGHRALTKPMTYCGKNKHIIAYPIMQGRIVNVAAFISRPEEEGTTYKGPTISEDVQKDHMIDHFKTWEDEVQVLLESMQKPHRWAIETVRPLRFYAAGRVALVGDSAHAMGPHLGAGAGQGIEDAYILATILSNAPRSKIDLSRALEIYSAIRQPVGNSVSASTRRVGQLVEFHATGYRDIKENDNVPPERLEQVARLTEQLMRWGERTSAEEDRHKALQLMKQGMSIGARL